MKQRWIFFGLMIGLSLMTGRWPEANAGDLEMGPGYQKIGSTTYRLTDATKLSDVLSLINDSSDLKRYTIQLPSGVYYMNDPVELKNHVNLVGMGKDSTVLWFHGQDPAITVANSCQIRMLSIWNYPNDGPTYYHNIGIEIPMNKSAVVSHVKISLAQPNAGDFSALSASGIRFHQGATLVLMDSDITVNISGSYENFGVRSMGDYGPELMVKNTSIQVKGSDFNCGISLFGRPMQLSDSYVTVSTPGTEHWGIRAVATSPGGLQDYTHITNTRIDSVGVAIYAEWALKQSRVRVLNSQVTGNYRSFQTNKDVRVDIANTMIEGPMFNETSGLSGGYNCFNNYDKNLTDVTCPYL